MSFIFIYLSFSLLMLQKRFMGGFYFALAMSVRVLCVRMRVWLLLLCLILLRCFTICRAYYRKH